MKKLLLMGTIIGCLLTISIQQAYAFLLSVDDGVFGVDSITRDTATGLDWLDLRLSLNRSFNDLTGLDGTNEFLVGGDFEGFRYATVSEINTLFLNANIPDIESNTEANFVPIQNLQNLVGVNAEGITLDLHFFFSYGIASDSAISHPTFKQLPYLQSEIFTKTGQSPLTSFRFDPEEASLGIGSWLIRNAEVSPNPVPEPATILLFGSGMVSVFLRRKNRKA